MCIIFFYASAVRFVLLSIAKFDNYDIIHKWFEVVAKSASEFVPKINILLSL